MTLIPLANLLVRARVAEFNHDTAEASILRHRAEEHAERLLLPDGVAEALLASWDAAPGVGSPFELDMWQEH